MRLKLHVKCLITSSLLMLGESGCLPNRRLDLSLRSDGPGRLPITFVFRNHGRQPTKILKPYLFVNLMVRVIGQDGRETPYYGPIPSIAWNSTGVVVIDPAKDFQFEIDLQQSNFSGMRLSGPRAGHSPKELEVYKRAVQRLTESEGPIFGIERPGKYLVHAQYQIDGSLRSSLPDDLKAGIWSGTIAAKPIEILVTREMLVSKGSALTSGRADGRGSRKTDQ